MNIESSYPKLFGRLEDKELELRHLLSINENYEDIDEEEFDFDFEEYNYIIYMTESISEILQTKNMEILLEKLDKNSNFTNFKATELDLYGVWYDGDENELAILILDLVEEML
jgi:hypothetical protein